MVEQACKAQCDTQAQAGAFYIALYTIEIIEDVCTMGF